MEDRGGPALTFLGASSGRGATFSVMPTGTGEEDWRPELSTIDDPIADDEWEFEGPGGEKRKMRVVVGRPAALPGKDWYTPISIEGFTSGVRPAYGVGPADSLMKVPGP